MRKIFIIITLFFSYIVYSQNPGGVDGVSIWLKTDKEKISDLLYMDYSGNYHQISAPSVNNKPSYSLINYNETLFFDGKDNFLQVPYVFENLDKVNLFTVYQNENIDNESALFTTEKSGEKELFYSSANLWRYNNEQINYLNDKKLDTLTSFAMYSKFDFPSGKIKEIQGDTGLSNLYIGKDITKKWRSFKGKLPEFFIYRRILDQNELDRINTYLSVKYAITNPYKEYLSSKSIKIWKKEDYKEFSNNIAAIARDDYSGLYQKQATSTSDRERLIIAALNFEKANNLNKANFKDQTFLVWGDNNDSLKLGKQEFGYQLLRRKWKTRYTSESSETLKNEIIFKINDLVSIPADKKLWLLIDKSGRNEFNSTEIIAIAADMIDEKGYAHFKNVEFDKDLSGTDVFSFAIGQKLFAAHQLIQPTCKKDTGEMSLNMNGGKAPYHVLIKNGDSVMNNTVSNDGKIFMNNLSVGTYEVSVSDSENTKSDFRFSVDNFKDLDIDLGIDKEIKDGEYVELDASKNIMDGSTIYNWSSNNGFTSNQPKIKIYEAGEYTVNITTKDGCSKTDRINVYKSINKGIVIYPNPTKAGEYFNINASLDKIEDINVHIFDGSGRLVKTVKKSGDKVYNIKESIDTQGSYIVLVFTNTEKKTFKLIIE